MEVFVAHTMCWRRLALAEKMFLQYNDDGDDVTVRSGDGLKDGN